MTSLARMLPEPLKRYARQHSGAIGSVVAVDTAEPVIVLTYDDGPVPGNTDRILEVLARHEATATFFMLLTRARLNPTLVTDVVAAGHEVALHGLDHRPLTSFSYRDVQRRTLDGRAELEDLSERKVRWVRPPYGKQTLTSWRAVVSTGLVPVMWGPTTGDSRELPPSERVTSALRGATSGAIVLAHDGYADHVDGVDDGPTPRLDRAELAEQVLSEYRDLGLRACSLAAALVAGTPQRRAWFGR